jgi:ribosomal protein S18 acetylase RimI-like enzyme
LDNIQIEQIRPELTWRLRREVLYPDEPLHTMEMDEDNYGLHFGAFYEDKLISVVSLFQQNTDFQFRKFAVAGYMQHQGVGNKMLDYITQFTVEQGGFRIWCNARLSAIGFYTKAGFRLIGESFLKNGFQYQIMEKTLK